MRSIDTEGATINEAIERALELLHVTRDQAEVEILENATRGILGFGGKPARVRARVRAPLQVSDQDSSHADVNVSRETANDIGRDASATGLAAAAFERILRDLGIDAAPQIDGPRDGALTLSVGGQDSGILIGRHGQTLDAIEYLLNRIAAQRGTMSIRIGVDVEGYRERRQESLEQTARRLAAQAKQTGRPASLGPMSPRDRRIVHLALSDDREVTTRSQGEGSYRRVVIIPSRSAGRARPSA
jgi:spoIIIJ-associated protein